MTHMMGMASEERSYGHCVNNVVLKLLREPAVSNHWDLYLQIKPKNY